LEGKNQNKNKFDEDIEGLYLFRISMAVTVNHDISLAIAKLI